MAEIIDINTPWEGLSGNQVEGIVKQTLNEKFGDSYFDSTTYTQYFFRSTEDKLAWLNGDTSVETRKCPFEFTDKIRQVSVVNYMDGKSLYYTQVSTEATITVGFKSEEKGLTETSWTEVLEDAYFTVAVDRGFTGKYTNIIDNQLVLSGDTLTFDVLKYLATGNNRVKVTVEGADTGAVGNIVYTALLTTMYLAPSNFKWNVPFVEGSAYSLGGVNIGGNIDKILKIKVSNEQTYSKLYEVNIGTQTFTGIAYFYDGLEFPTEGTGIYNVEMWLDANGLESEHLHYNIICVAQADMKTAQLIAISNVPASVKNYDTNNLFSYAIYNGGATIASPVLNVSAIINNTPTPIVVDEVLENVATGEINTYVMDLEVDTQETNIQLYASIALEGSKQEAIYAIDNSASFPAVAGAEFYLNPANRNNAQPNKTEIVNESNLAAATHTYEGTWKNISFTDGMDGWTVDNYGRKCLRIPATCKVEVNYAPFANATTRTIELSYRVENTSNYAEDIISIASELTSNFVGARVKPTNVLLHSSLLKTDDLMQGYNTKDEELVHLMITIVQSYKRIGNLAQIYVNGVKKCSFEWSAGDTFAHNGTLAFGSDTADLYIYKMRVYTSAFEWPAVMQNFISCLPDTTSKKAAYQKMFSVINDGYQVDFDKVKNGGFNYFVIRLPDGKSLPSILSQNSVSGTRLEINIQQNKDFVINGIYEDETTEGQGTTAMNYFRWNLRWKTERVRVTAKKNFASSMHSHKMGGTALFNDLNLMLVGPNEANGRVAVEQYGAYGFLEVLLEGTTDQYTYIPIGLYTIGQDKGDKATFGYNNKEYKGTLIHLEGTDHSPKAVGMDYPWHKLSVATNTDGDANLGVVKKDGSVIAAWEIGACGSAESDPEMLEYLAEEFKPAYDMDYLNTSMLVALEAGTSIDDINANLAAFRAIETDLGYTNADCLVWIDGEYETYYYDVIEEKYLKDGVNILTDLGISASDLTGTAYEKNLEIRRLRMERYRSQMENYWHLRDNLFHYCFIVLFAATDNFKKNTYPYKFGTLGSGSRWRWRQDDLDTMFDINNQGLANKIYSLLNGDKSGTTHLFRGNTSYHWTNIQFYYDNEIKGMMLEILNAMASLSDTGNSLLEKAVGCVRKYFWNKAQDYFTKSAYNIDAEWSYEEAWAAMKNGTYAAPVHPLQQSLGSHYEAEVAWVELRFLFMASLYGFGAFAVGNDSDTTLGQISFRPAQGDNTFRLTPAVNMNPTILVGDSDAKSAGRRLVAGETAEITIGTDGDTSIYIQGADYLSDIGDFSKIHLYAENPALTVQSKRLQKLKVGDGNPENVETVLKTLNVLSCPSLSEVDARNVTTLTGTIDLSKCPRLVRALFGGSSAGEVIIPNGSKIEELELPDSLTNLSLVNLPNLDVEGLKYGDLTALTYLRLENNKSIEGYALLKATFADGAPLTNIRVVGFDYVGDATDAALLASLANGEYFGIDSDGTRNPNIIPVLEGTLTLTTPIYDSDYEAIQKAYGAGLVINLSKGFYVSIKDPKVLEILLANITTDDGVGLTTEDIEGVQSIGTWFVDNTEIETFDEFERFTSVKIITNAFRGATSLRTIKFPEGLETISGQYKDANGCFQGCTSLESVTFPEGLIALANANNFKGCTSLKSVNLELPNLTEMGIYAFGDCPSLIVENINLPKLTSIGVCAFYGGANVKKIESLGKITSLPSQWNERGVFHNNTLLESVNLPDTLTNIGAHSFNGCSSLKNINFPESVKTIDKYAFYNCSALTNVDLSNVTSLGHYVFSNCTSLSFEELNLPNLTSLGQDAFYGVKIKKLNLGKVTTLPTATANTQNYGDKSVLEEVVIPEGVTSIPNASFYGYALVRTTIPKSVATIGAQAFYGCKALEGEVDVPNATKVDYGAFYNSAITSFNGESVTTINGGNGGDSGAFSTCKSLKSVSIPSAASIGPKAFNNCSALESIELPSVVTVSYAAFIGCSAIKSIDIGALVTMIDYQAFGSSKAAETIICRATTPPTIKTPDPLPSNTCPIFVPAASITAYAGATNWSAYADRLAPLEDHEDGGYVPFADSAVEAICVANWDANASGYMSKNEVEAVTGIANAFYKNTEVEYFNEFEMFTGVTYLVNSNASASIKHCFYGCTNLKEITLPSSLTTINNGTESGQSGAFFGCTSLTKVEGMEHLVSIGRYAFRGCTSLAQDINLPNAEGTLGTLAFYQTAITKIVDLGKITILDGQSTASVNSPQGPFARCASLVEAHLPATLTEIRKGAFGFCTALTTLIIDAVTPPTLDANAWYGSNALANIYVPDAAVNTYKSASNWSTYANLIKPMSQYNG